MKVRVDSPPPLPAEYDVVIEAGALDDLPRRITASGTADRYAIISPDPVAALHGEPLLVAMRNAGLDAELLAFPDGEICKTRETWAALTDRMLALRFGRDSCVIAVGGGVAGDLAGFVAATYMRGVPVIQVPTTLLAMIDAAVGGKTGVDTDAGKNLVGAFHPPRLVVMDPVVLGTLPDAAFHAGLAEAVKHGAMLDAAYFDWIADRASAILQRDTAELQQLVGRSVELKAGVVAGDPFDRGRRAVLNFGHTVAHALERQAAYALPHGLAVSMGMVVEALAGEALGVTEAGTAGRLVDGLRACGLPTVAPAGDTHELMAAMRIDKKAHRDAVHCALPRRIGEAAQAGRGRWTHEVADAMMMDVLMRASRGLDVV
jgi:3-dehydroquinate synthase